MSNLLVRFVSGVLAAVFLFSTAYWAGVRGLKAASAIIVILAAFELRKIFLVAEPKWKATIFLAVTLMPLTWILEAFIPNLPVDKLLIFETALLSVFFLSCGVLMGRFQEQLTSIFSFDSRAVLGLIYIGVLPWFAIHLTDFPRGEYWLIALLLIVFFGDIFAYFFGRAWGHKKVLPSISPKKTVIGAFGGILGSTVAGLINSQVLPEMPLWAWVLLAPCVGFVAQIGDFSESLFKRVAQVKDSGSIMPGHGGVLDRIDGVLFAAPVFYVLVYINFLA